MKTGETCIRKAGPEDAAVISELGAKTFVEAFGAENRPEDMHAYVADAFSIDTIAREIQDPKSSFFLAYLDDAKVGYVKLRRSEPPECVAGPDPIEIERIYVDKGHQGAGVGASLIRTVIGHAKALGCKTVWLGVWETNAAARRFYERQGFEPVGRKDFLLGKDRQTDVVMRRLLD